MRTALLLASLSTQLLSACSDCSPMARPDLEIGTGETAYEPLDPTEPVYDLVHGPQGGWHVLVGLRAAGLDATQIVTATLTGRVDGSVVALNEGAWLTFRCEEETRSLQSWNTFLIFDVESDCELHEAELEVEATVTDARGKQATATTTATIIDGLYEEECVEE